MTCRTLLLVTPSRTAASVVVTQDDGVPASAGPACSLPCRGSEQAGPAEAGTPSSWVTTTEAAVRLGVTSSRVRQVIRAKHLVAEQVDHQWRIALQDLAHYVAARAASDRRENHGHIHAV